jgi:hypothetical protein
VITADRGPYHVLGGDEGVVDGDELDIVALEGDPGDEPSDPSETCAKSATKITTTNPTAPHSQKKATADR